MHPILAERRRLLLFLLASLLVGVGLALLVHIWLLVPWRAALSFGLPLGLLAAPLALSAWYLARSMPLAPTSAGRLVLTAGIAAGLTSALWAAAGSLWAQALAPLGFALEETTPAALASLLVGFGALGYLLSLTVHYALLGFEESAEA
jgi:hypothetical protein